MSLDDQNRLRCITQTQKILKNQSSYLTLLDGISPQCSAWSLILLSLSIPCYIENLAMHVNNDNLVGQ